MRIRHLLFLVTVLVLAIGVTPAQAQKGGNGKGGGKQDGGDDGGSSTNLPPVAYEVDFQPVEGLKYNGVMDASSDGNTLVRLDVSALTASIPTDWVTTLGVVAPDGSITYPELQTGTENWDFPSNLGWINDSGQIASTGVQNGEVRAFVYLPPASPGASAQVIADDGAPLWADGVQVRDFTNDGKVLLWYVDHDSTLVEHWVWMPFEGIRIPIGVADTLNGEPIFREDLSFDFLTTDGRLYGAFVDGTSVTGYFQSDVVTDTPFAFAKVQDASDSGYSIFPSRQQVKRKGRFGPVLTITAYDAAANAVTSETLEWGIDVPKTYLSEEVINGVPVLAASIYGNVPANLWLKIPGYDGCTITDLMNTGELADWAAIDFANDGNANVGGSTAYPECYTPEFSVSGAPAFVGEAYRIDPGYLGIYRIRPVPVP